MTEADITIEEGTSTDPNQILKIAHISGQLDESNIDEKIKVIYDLVEKNPKNLNLLLDLENLEYMNSKSIGYITDLYGKITEAGGQVAIAKAKPNIMDILQVVGLTQLIMSFDSLEEAKAHLLNTTAATDLAAGNVIEVAAQTTPEITTTPTEAPTEVPVQETPVQEMAPQINQTPNTPVATNAEQPTASENITVNAPTPQAEVPTPEIQMTPTQEEVTPVANPAPAPTPTPTTEPQVTPGTFNLGGTSTDNPPATPPQ